MEKVFIDTGGWVALFVESDENHEKAVSIFEKIKKQKLEMYTSDYVIDETITTILVRGGHKQSIAAGEALFSSKIMQIINVSPEYVSDTWKLYKKYKDKVFSFTDVSCFIIMKAFDIKKAFSFDREFVQAGIQLIN